MPELNEEQAAFSHRLLERRGIEVRLYTRIKGATAQTAILTDDLTIPTRTVVAAIGSAPNRLLDTIPCSRDSWSRVVVDETLAVPECPEVWALGDCAAVPDVRRGGTCPPTAQYALREAKHLARNILDAATTIDDKKLIERVRYSLGIIGIEDRAYVNEFEAETSRIVEELQRELQSASRSLQSLPVWSPIDR